MRQNSRAESSHPSSPAIALHPVLSLALANLDIQLENELTRYRRQRTSAGRTVPPSHRTQPPQPLDLIAIAATSERSAPTSAATMPQPNPALEDRLTSVSEPTIAPDAYKPIPAFTASPQPFEAAIALRTPAKPLSPNGSPEQSSLEVDGDEAHALAHATNPKLDDYLESSEELLRSLADEQAEVRAERNFMQSLLTPLGLGAMLLLLLSSAMFGYVIMNPSSLGWLAAKQNGHSADTPGQAPGQAALAPPQPDLAKRELPELNLNNLGTVNVSPGLPGAKASATTPTTATPSTTTSTTATPSNKSTISATASSVAPRSEAPAPVRQAPAPAVSANSSRSAPSRSSAPSQAIAPSRTTMAPSQSAPPKTDSAPVTPLPTRAATSTTTRSTATDAYPIKVITHYDNDSALTKSRTVVPDAYLRNFPNGAKVQLGAYDNPAAAEAKAQELRSQGIPAEVYKP